MRVEHNPIGGEVDVAIVGAGVTGLYLAYRIARERPDLSVIVLEAGCRLGSTADVMGSLLASGAQQFLLNVPNTPSLNGVDLYEQLAVFTPGINPLGIEMSPTMRIHLSSK